jgi:uncharacterized delta-60 repeat protein
MPNLTRAARLVAASLLTQAFLGCPGLRAQQLDPSFHAPVFTVAATYGTPYADHVRQQADGRYLVSGRFQAVDSHATAGIARLLADGHVDTTFTFRSTTFLPSGGWAALAVQADGKVMAASRVYASAGRPNLFRLLPSGRPDTSFHPALGIRSYGNEFNDIVVQPDGKLLLTGAITDSLGRNGLVRLLPSGRVDAVFNPPVLPVNPGVVSVALEPSGRMVCSRSPFETNNQPATMTRLLASGRVDSTFVFTPMLAPTPFATAPQISKVVRCPDGSYVLAGFFSNRAVAHLTPTGAWDTAFPFSIGCYAIAVGFSLSNPIGGLAVQTDGRILVSGGLVSAAGNSATVGRAFRTGGSDASFDPDFIFAPYQYDPTSPVSNAAKAYDLLLEPSGRLLVAGEYTQAGNVAHTGLARLLPAAPLATRGSAAATAPLEVWPVPAHAQLTVKLPAGPLPQQVALLDATGRTVLARQSYAATLTLPTAALPAGLYVLRVQHADGSVASRRVVVE